MPYLNPKNPPLPADPEPRQYRDGKLVKSEQSTTQNTQDSWEPDGETTEG